jgi:hypothetical protein
LIIAEKSLWPVPVILNLQTQVRSIKAFQSQISDGRTAMIYLEKGQLQEISDEIADGKTKRMPFFRKGVIKDPMFAHRILALHKDFEKFEISLLEKGSRFHSLITGFVFRHCPENHAWC